jgi:hypothetical protein
MEIGTSLTTKLLLGTGIAGAVVAVGEVVSSVPAEMVSKAAPTPWEAIIVGAVAGVGAILRKYGPAEAKVDAHHAEIKSQLEAIILSGTKREEKSAEWRESTSRELGKIGERLEGQNVRLEKVEKKLEEIK